MRRTCFLLFVFIFAFATSLRAQSNPAPIINQVNASPTGASFLPHRLLEARRKATRSMAAALSPAGTDLDASSIFLEAPIYETGGILGLSMAIADVNRDGKVDIIASSDCANNTGNCIGSVSVMLGNGDGTFQAPVTYSSGGVGANSVAVADVNGDGKPDLIVANSCVGPGNCDNGTIGVLFGNGDGTFQPAVTYNSGGYEALSVVVEDVNGDGKPDLLVANLGSAYPNSNGAVSVLLGIGDGTFKAAASYLSGGEVAIFVAAADVNGDGNPDLVVANGSGSVGVLLGNGDGTFKPVVTYGSGGNQAESVAVADVNGDGKLDLLVGNCATQATGSSCDGSTGALGVLLGNGDGTFKPAVSYGSGGIGAASVAVADVNEDGKLDVIVTNDCATSGGCSNGSVGVLLGNGDGTFQPAVSYGVDGDTPVAVAIADVNADGKLDLVVADFALYSACEPCSSGAVSVLLGNGDGTFQAAPIYGPGGNGVASIQEADLNGDGKLDLVVANNCADSNCTNGSVGVLLGDGDGTFKPAVTYSSGGIQAESVAIADVNGDGKLDLIVANACADSNCTHGSVGVLLGNGDGTFKPAVTYNSGGYSALSVVVADLNGDGKLDLIVANHCTNSDICLDGTSDGVVGVLLGNGDGTFRSAVSYDSGGFGAESVAVADVSGDGKPDLLVANCASDVGACYEGSGSSGSIGVLLGNGDGTFKQAVTYSSGGIEAESVAVADVNGDGKLDLVVSNSCAASNCTNGLVGVLLGNGDGTFQGPTTIATPVSIGPGSMVVADFNADDNLDIASGAGDFLLLGNGDGTFQSPLFLGAAGAGIAVGDFNNDGSPDLAVGGVTILLNRIHTNRTSPTTTTIDISLDPSTFGQLVTLSASVVSSATGTPTGAVTFFDGTTDLGSSFLNDSGLATLAISALTAGTHTITASYSGDSHFQPSIRMIIQKVNRATTKAVLKSSPNPSLIGQSVTFTATVVTEFGDTPTGAVQFKTEHGSGLLATATLNSGTASFTTKYSTAGVEYPVYAVYIGDGNLESSVSNSVTQRVNKIPASTTLASSLNPSNFGQSITFTATVVSSNGTPTGTVTFRRGTVALKTTPLHGGIATFSTSVLEAGTYSLNALYNGDSNFAASTSTPLGQNINKLATTTTLTSSLNPSRTGHTVVFTAAVMAASGTPTGFVTFQNKAMKLGTVPLNGRIATLRTSSLPSGTDNITAIYGGDTNDLDSTSAKLNQVVQ